ncbi:hypothetical protein [Paenibacillus sp. J22TS3]|uniref:hypothetical protein n=1 Tax=Paenibacillus sp. J22TS3 TaxID=2807192 RepID=UPI001B08D0D7|nr:hypothetical protein [Paenibacillus sp. J22TS3]GIP24431.1 hypothetical protein J22TS3_47060 [Paenibacillus sp. J22TS3]
MSISESISESVPKQSSRQQTRTGFGRDYGRNGPLREQDGWRDLKLSSELARRLAFKVEYGIPVRKRDYEPDSG